MKRHSFILGVFLCLMFSALSCRRSYQDSQLVGYWQMVTNRITQTYTFSPDHTFVSAFASSKDLRHFGNWTLDEDQLAITVRSNSFSPLIVSNRTTARITQL